VQNIRYTFYDEKQLKFSVKNVNVSYKKVIN